MLVIQRNFTKYDDTDELKRMKDSDILAERYRDPETSIGEIALDALRGAAIGGGLGGVIGGGRSFRKGLSGNKAVNLSLKDASIGAILGAAVEAGRGISRRKKEKKRANFFNRRLKYAKKRAKLRESEDWKANMNNRDGYSF